LDAVRRLIRLNGRPPVGPFSRRVEGQDADGSRWTAMHSRFRLPGAGRKPPLPRLSSQARPPGGIAPVSDSRDSKRPPACIHRCGNSGATNAQRAEASVLLRRSPVGFRLRERLCAVFRPALTPPRRLARGSPAEGHRVPHHVGCVAWEPRTHRDRPDRAPSATERYRPSNPNHRILLHPKRNLIRLLSTVFTRSPTCKPRRPWSSSPRFQAGRRA